MLTVRPVAETDLPALAALFAEMRRFYGATEIEPAAEREEQLRALLFDGQPIAQVIVAHDEAVLAGFASYTFHWPAVGLTKSLFLKELYVTGSVRGRGAGKALMREVFRVAAETGCSRVEWMTDLTNTDAQAFYERIGAQPNTAKVFYRRSSDDFPSSQR